MYVIHNDVYQPQQNSDISTAFENKHLYNIAAQLYNEHPKDFKDLSILELKKKIMLENVN